MIQDCSISWEHIFAFHVLSCLSIISLKKRKYILLDLNCISSKPVGSSVAQMVPGLYPRVCRCDLLCVCVNALRPSQQMFSHVGTCARLTVC